MESKGGALSPVRNQKSGNVKRVAPQRRRNQIPDEILHNDALNSAMSLVSCTHLNQISNRNI
jgi:hypothetical protein